MGEAVLEEGGGGDLEGGPEQGEGGRGRGQSVPLDLSTGALHHPRPDRFPGLTLFLENSCEATTIIKLLVCFLSSCTRCSIPLVAEKVSVVVGFRFTRDQLQETDD